jgi:surface antigen
MARQYGTTRQTGPGGRGCLSPRRWLLAELARLGVLFRRSGVRWAAQNAGRLTGKNRRFRGVLVALVLLIAIAAVQSAGAKISRAPLQVRVHLSSSRAKDGVILRAAIHTVRGARCVVVVRPPRHIAGLPPRFTLRGLRANNHGRVDGMLLLSPAAPTGTWATAISCAEGKRLGSAASKIRLGKGHGSLGGRHTVHTCMPSNPTPGCVSVTPVVQSTPPPGGFGGAGGCQPFGTILVPASAWLNGHGVDVISNGCTWYSTIYGQYGWEYQCVELFERLINQEGWYHGGVGTAPSGGAKDLYPNASSSAFDKYANGSGYIPVPGDAIVFYGYPGDPYGHVAIVRSVNANSIGVVEQNDLGSGRTTLALSGSTVGNEGPLTVEGILHAKLNTQGPPPPSGSRSVVAVANPNGNEDVFVETSGGINRYLLTPSGVGGAVIATGSFC